MRYPREVLAAAEASGRLLYAPLVGEANEVDVSAFRFLLRGRIVSHNHPHGTMLSLGDLRVAIDCNVLRIEALGPDGEILAWNRPEAGWPEEDTATRAYIVGFNRAARAAKTRAATRDELRAQVDRAFAKTLGPEILRIEVSRVE